MKNKESGECANGTYLYAVEMIIVDRLTVEIIRQTVAHLLAIGDLDSACTLQANPVK